jgi:Domain of Unknown Function (DUF1259)
MKEERLRRELIMLKSCAALSIVAAAAAAVPISGRAQEVPAEYQKVLSTLGKQGDFKDNVLKVNIPRNDVKVTVAGMVSRQVRSTSSPCRNDLKVVEMGATINARMGLNTWAAFTGTNDKAAIAGDVAMLESEVTPVLKALRKNGLDVVAIHHHMTADRPMIIFLHYWGTGPADKLASAFKAAVNALGKHGAPTSSR